MRTKRQSFISAIQILAIADLRNGISREKLESDIDKYIDEEKYEVCEGLKRALKLNK